MCRSRSVSPEAKKQKKKYHEILKKYNRYEKAHFEDMSEHEKDELVSLEQKLEESALDSPEPLRFKFLKLNICNTVKNIIISKLEQLNRMTPCSGEYFKLSNWINTLAKIPIGKYHTLPITNLDADIATYLQGVKQTIDSNIFGHEETKDQIVRILAQWISNPNSNGYVIGIQGSPGVGKTKLIKEGICKAMNYPYAFISLGGISDASYLTGHHYTYEGATYGKIIECLIKSRVMNPVFLFDELDKVSNTSRGDEIINTLIHITDPVQNDRYSDKYFEEIDLDLSKALIIFTYNDENMINPILKDRMITIKVSGYNAKQKLTICKSYILPELVPQYNMKKEDIVIDEALLKNIIDTYGNEEGVRNLKRILNDILSCVNMMRYIPTDGIEIKFPFHVTPEYYNKYCNKTDYKRCSKQLSMYA
jgi:ATP-dependent Lon protease